MVYDCYIITMYLIIVAHMNKIHHGINNSSQNQIGLSFFFCWYREDKHKREKKKKTKNCILKKATRVSSARRKLDMLGGPLKSSYGMDIINRTNLGKKISTIIPPLN